MRRGNPASRSPILVAGDGEGRAQSAPAVVAPAPRHVDQRERKVRRGHRRFEPDCLRQGVGGFVEASGLLQHRTRAEMEQRLGPADGNGAAVERDRLVGSLGALSGDRQGEDFARIGCGADHRRRGFGLRRVDRGRGTHGGCLGRLPLRCRHDGVIHSPTLARGGLTRRLRPRHCYGGSDRRGSLCAGHRSPKPQPRSSDLWRRLC